MHMSSFILVFSLAVVCCAEMLPSPKMFPARTENSSALEGSCPSEQERAKLRRQISEDILTALVGLTSSTPASSCSAIDPSSPSGYYWILPPAGPPAVQLYCDFNRQCGCDGPSTWTRVAFLNMTDPIRACSRTPAPGGSHCTSAVFPTLLL